MEMGTGNGFCKIILFFSLMLLIMSLPMMLFTGTASPEFAIVVMTVATNGITVIGASIYLRSASKKVHK